MIRSIFIARIPKILAVLPMSLLLSSLVSAQKEAPMPKDLPAYGPERPLQAPSVKSAKLDNGLSLWLVSEPGFPKVALTIAVRGGMAADPADRPGISELLARTIDQGTRTRNAKQIAQEIQATGGDLTADADKDSISLSTVILSSKLDAAVTTLADVLQNASFPDAEVTLAKRNLTDSLEQREAEPFFLASRARDNVLFGDHPYHVTAPTKESIAASTPADLREIFSQRFRPDQVILIAVGDFQNDKMLQLAKSSLGGWKAPTTPTLAAPPAPPAQVEHAVFVVVRPGSVQTTLDLGTFGPLRGDADYEASQVANAIYGGSFSSRLTSNIREDKGYTYSPYSFLSPFQKSGEIVSHADVRNEVTGPSLNEIQYELNRLATTSPTDDELSKAKHYLVGREALRMQDRASLAQRLAILWIDGLEPGQIGVYGRKVAETTSADVNAAARKYFTAYRTAIIAVGEEKVIREAVAPLGIPVRMAQ
jgi:predicted Zn-dependent peptidase